MLKRSQYWVLSAIGALCVVLVVANMVLFSGNQGLQGQVNERAQYIQQSVQLQGLYQQMVRALADLSVKNNDEQLSAVLAKQGIKVTPHAPAAGNGSGAEAGTDSSSAGRESGTHERRGSGHRE